MSAHSNAYSRQNRRHADTIITTNIVKENNRGVLVEVVDCNVISEQKRNGMHHNNRPNE